MSRNLGMTLGVRACYWDTWHEILGKVKDQGCQVPEISIVPLGLSPPTLQDIPGSHHYDIEDCFVHVNWLSINGMWWGEQRWPGI